ncbi:MAG: hypothetical protein ACI8SA_001831, partial [Dokdonia sp.]
MNFITTYTFFCLTALTVATTTSFAQERQNPITTAVPFLTITPDARHGALGGAGAATSPDVYDNFHNAAKLAFMTDDA